MLYLENYNLSHNLNYIMDFLDQLISFTGVLLWNNLGAFNLHSVFQTTKVNQGMAQPKVMNYAKL